MVRAPVVRVEAHEAAVAVDPACHVVRGAEIVDVVHEARCVAHVAPVVLEVRVEVDFVVVVRVVDVARVVHVAVVDEVVLLARLSVRTYQPDVVQGDSVAVAFVGAVDRLYRDIVV